jgi:hypothetical protein
MKQIKLGLYRFAQHININPASFEPYEHEDALCWGTVVRGIKASFPFESQKPLRFQYIDNWFEYFKLRWFPAWLLKKYPVKYAVKEWDVKTIYPNLTTQLPVDVLGPYVCIAVNSVPTGVFLTDPMGSTIPDWNEKVEHSLFSELRGRVCKHCGRDFKFFKP